MDHNNQPLDKIIYFTALFCLRLGRRGLCKPYKGFLYKKVPKRKSRIPGHLFVRFRRMKTKKTPCKFMGHRINIPRHLKSPISGRNLLGTHYGYFVFLPTNKDSEIYNFLVGPVKSIGISYSRCIEDVISFYKNDQSRWDGWDKNKYTLAAQLIEARHPKLATSIWEAVASSTKLAVLLKKALKLKHQEMLSDAQTLSLYSQHEKLSLHLWERMEKLVRDNISADAAAIIKNPPSRIDNMLYDRFDDMASSPNKRVLTPKLLLEEYAKIANCSREQMLNIFISSDDREHRLFAIHAGGSTEMTLGFLDQDPVVRLCAQLVRDGELNSEFT